MRALVTGASGFVGSWLTRDLCRRGLDVRVLLRHPEGAKEFEDLNLEVAVGDVTNFPSLISAMDEVEWVFHLAGSIHYSSLMRPLMEEVNVRGTANILRAAERSGIKKLLHMSSVATIGASFDQTVLNEDSPFLIEDLNLGYFATKREAERLVQEAVKAGQVDAVIVNPATIYGAGDARKGSRGTQIRVAKGRFPFYPSGGVNVVGVEEVIEALWEAINRGRIGERYILSGENILVKDLFSMIAEAAGKISPFIYLPNKMICTLGKWGDSFEKKKNKKSFINTETAWISTLFHWFDSSKAQRELGFRPQSARESIKNSVNWMKENHVI